MDPLNVARWQFGITTVYHFLFVPITIGMAFFIAITETAWVRTRKPVYLRATKFWGKVFLINFAIGVVTGIVQEFQFGMNWSSYSRFVGDVFGAPLAMEALLAFFLESTFLGLWIFGWDKLSPRLHCAAIWLVSIGTMLSAFFIMSANSFMQHPVGITVNPDRSRAEMNDIWAVLTQPLNMWAYSHVIAGAILSGAAMFAGISSYFLMKKRDVDVFRPAVRFGLVGMLIGSLAVIITGDLLAKVMTDVQPMKMAAAEALWDTTEGASFSLFTIGTLDGTSEVFSIRVPGVLSFMATESFSGTVEGINDVQAQFEQKYGPGDYRPNIPVTYWMFRLMMGAGFVMLLVSIVGLWLTRKGRLPKSRTVWLLAMFAIAGPVVGHSAGWIFTEMGRQPWTVVGLYRTEESVSPSVTGGSVLTSLIIFTVLYGILAVIEIGLVVKYVKIGPPSEAEALASIRRRTPRGGGFGGPDRPADTDEEEEKPLAFAY
ncbi:cytochrome ubiquinol oxidase subunit I [Nakamurella sp.]|uniref:cytochrome ubiquinol oxidase subunit I n=1 Tax=Nakamurella sp. TaxID=1869182 RepID=UPI0037835A42